MASVNNHETRIKKIEDELMKVYNYTKNITVTSGQWASTGIKLPETGTYLINLFAPTSGYGGSQYSETYSGICSFYVSGTNSGEITEIPLTNAGHAPNSRFCALGFKRVGGNTGQQEFVITCNENVTNCPFTFSFRKVL